MEEELNIKNTEIVEDMPDFEENTAEMPCESAESVTECTADAENAIVSEENEPKSEENAEESTEKTDEPKKKEEYKPNLPVGFSFNPLVIAIKPFYDKLIAEDTIFADVVKERESRAEKPKSLAECAEYIMGEAYEYARNHKQGNFGLAGFPDEQMPVLIRHYYDEEFIEIRKITGARASVTHTAPKTADKAKKTEKKAKDKPKPVKNVHDITKAIVASTGKESGKKAKKKDSLDAGFVPMERPDTEKEAKKGSREQAKSIVQIDMFADFFAEKEEK